MGIKGSIQSRNGLQIRMTARVTIVVLLVSSIVLLIIADRIRKDYETLLNDRISDDLTAISRIMEQRLLRVESTTEVIASLVSLSLNDEKELDSLLFHALKEEDEVKAVSIVFDKGYVPGIDGYCERYSVYDNAGHIQLGVFVNNGELENDPDWICSFVEGKSQWGEITSKYVDSQEIICYCVPLTDSSGKRVGMVYSATLSSCLTSFVTEYKVRKDIDISIYKANGTMIVAPDEYILKLSPENKIVRQSVIGDIDWKIILSADREIIHKVVARAMLSLLVLFALMFIAISMAIRFTVRYVAKPFIEEKNRTEREKAVMENEMLLAAGAQNELVPHTFPPFPDHRGIDISACLHPARSVGGDLYDYFISGNCLHFCIGDVSGKGVQAALFMAAAHYLFRNVANGMGLADAARQMNTSLCSDNESCRFITFWMGKLHLDSGELEYINAGHDAPILVREDGVGSLPASDNMPLAVWDEEEYVPGLVTLMPGDRILLFTDGITEAMDSEGRAFGLENLVEAVKKSTGDDTGSLIGSVLDTVRLHSGETPQSDDITMLCLKFIGYETNKE